MQTDSRVREALADLAHRQWSGWMEYLFAQCTPTENGDVLMPAWAAERWRRQMATPYAALSEAEKDSVRAEVDALLALIGDPVCRCP